MSFKVLVIPEDPTHNGAILKPLVEVVLAEAGRPNAQVKVLDNPRVQGFDQAVAAIRGELLDRYAWMDLWVFVPDADRASRSAMDDLEAAASARGVRLFCCPAVPEIEVVACVPFRAETGMSWDDLRRHPRLKEAVFERLLARHGDPRRPAGGRDRMVAAALQHVEVLYRLCPEIATLRDRIAAHLAGRA